MKQVIFLSILLWCNNSFTEDQKEKEYEKALKSIDKLTQTIRSSKIQDSFKKAKKEAIAIQTIFLETQKRVKEACSDEIVKKNECEKEKKNIEELENKNKEIINSLNAWIQAISTINLDLNHTLKTGINNRDQIFELKNLYERALLKAYFQDKTPVIINSKAFCENVLKAQEGNCSTKVHLEEANKIKNEIFKESDSDDEN